MAFAVFTDGSANLPKKLLEGISLLPNEYSVDDVPQSYWGMSTILTVMPIMKSCGKAVSYAPVC